MRKNTEQTNSSRNLVNGLLYRKKHAIKENEVNLPLYSNLLLGWIGTREAFPKIKDWSSYYAFTLTTNKELCDHNVYSID
jgi:hypothetical protein